MDTGCTPVMQTPIYSLSLGPHQAGRARGVQGPQSAQSVPRSQSTMMGAMIPHMEGGCATRPSSHTPSLACMHACDGIDQGAWSMQHPSQGALKVTVHTLTDRSIMIPLSKCLYILMLLEMFQVTNRRLGPDSHRPSSLFPHETFQSRNQLRG